MSSSWVLSNWFAPIVALLNRVPPVPIASRPTAVYSTAYWPDDGGSHEFELSEHGKGRSDGMAAVKVKTTKDYMHVTSNPRNMRSNK